MCSAVYIEIYVLCQEIHGLEQYCQISLQRLVYSLVVGYLFQKSVSKPAKVYI